MLSPYYHHIRVRGVVCKQSLEVLKNLEIPHDKFKKTHEAHT